MKKYLIFMFVFGLCFFTRAFGDCCPEKPKSLLPETQTCFENNECKFLCFCNKKDELFKKLCLNETQKCKANKIQENYEFDTLALRESIQCEEEKLRDLEKSCANEKKIKSQKRVIKNLRKDLKKSCKCFKDDFIMILSTSQTKTFKKCLKEKCKEKCN